MEKKLNEIVSHFDLEGEVVAITPLGSGLINTTYKVTTESENTPDYVLQNVNTSIFPDMDLLMRNIVEVTGHIRAKYEREGMKDLDKHVLRFLPAKDGKYYYFDGEKHWRIMVFIPDTVTKTQVNAETSYSWVRLSPISRRCWQTFRCSWARQSRISTTWNGAFSS